MAIPLTREESASKTKCTT